MLEAALRSDDQIDAVILANLVREATGLQAAGSLVGRETERFPLERGGFRAGLKPQRTGIA